MSSNLEQRFMGSVRLVIWHLWRVGASTDLEVCFAAARESGMINADDEQFIRDCIACEKALSSGDANDGTTIDITEDLIHRLHMQAIKLNTADSA